jgi:nucleoside-diphosphate-sugar epimerase
VDLSFYKGKKVFITGHTGFKGTWLTKSLVNEGPLLQVIPDVRKRILPYLNCLV